MKNLRIRPSGDILLTNEMVENHHKELENYSMSNYLDFTTGNLKDKKFNFSFKNIKVISRDTYVTSATTMNLDPFTDFNATAVGTKKAMDFSEYLTDELRAKFKFTVFYKIKINKRLTNNNNVRVCFGICLINDTSNKVTWLNIGSVGNINDIPDLYEGICSQELAFTGYTKMFPWIQVNQPQATCDPDIDIIYATYEITSHNETESKGNRLVFYADGMRISQNGMENTNNYDIKNLKILLEDGSYLSKDKVTSCLMGSTTCTVPIGDNNILSVASQGDIVLRFDKPYGIINIEFDHNHLQHYHEKIDLMYNKISNLYTLYNSFADGQIIGIKNMFDYYSTTHVDLKMQTNGISDGGIQFNNIGDHFISARSMSFYNCNIEIVGNSQNIRERYAIRFKPPGNVNRSYMKAGSVSTGGMGGDYKLSAWVKVSEDCNTDIPIEISIRNSKDDTVISSSAYDMNKKGEWQLLHCYVNRSKINADAISVLHAGLLLSNTSWTKGYIEVGPSFSLTYTRIGDLNPQRIYMQNFAILSLNKEIVNNKSVYIECIPNTLIVSANPPLIIFGDDNGNAFEIRQNTSNRLEVYVNRSLKGTYTYIPNELVKIIINKNGKIYMNGILVTTVTFPSNITYCNMGYTGFTNYGNGSAPFSGLLRKIVSFRDEISDTHCTRATAKPKISLPINYINSYEEYPNRPLENYKRYFFPLKENLYDIRGDILLPSNGDIDNIVYGVGYSCGTSSTNKLNNAIYLHEGSKNAESLIPVNTSTNFGTFCGYFEVLDPENLSDDDFFAFKYRTNEIPPAEKRFKIKNSTNNFFKVSEYNILNPESIFNLYIKSRATIIFYDLRYIAGGRLKPGGSVAALAIRMQDLIDYNSDFTIMYDIEYTMGHGNDNGYMISSLGYNRGSNYFWFGKNLGTYQFAIGGGHNVTFKPNLIAYDWMLDNKLRYTLKHVKSEKRIYIKCINLKNQSVYANGYLSYDTDTLDFTYGGNVNSYTLIISGWGDSGGIANCNGTISNLHIIQKALSDDELARYLSPLSIGKDNLRAGLEFSELNNI